MTGVDEASPVRSAEDLVLRGAMEGAARDLGVAIGALEGFLMGEEGRGAREGKATRRRRAAALVRRGCGAEVLEEGAGRARKEVWEVEVVEVEVARSRCCCSSAARSERTSTSSSL